MARILLMIALTAASLAAKDRAWQTGNLLDNNLNPYFRPTASGGDAKSDGVAHMVGDFAVAVNGHDSGGSAVYDDYVIEGEDTVYLVEIARLRTSKAAHLSLSLPVSFAVEKNKLWIKDLDRTEYETEILRKVEKAGGAPGTMVASVGATPAPAKAAPAKASSKPDPFALAPVQAPAQQTPSPAASQSVTQPQPAPKREAVAKKPAPKPEPEKVVRTTEPSSSSGRTSLKERAWQSGQLLSVVNNSYFFNVTFSSDSEGSGWPFVEGSDGRYTVNGQIGVPTGSLYTYDNYLIESQYCVYLVQRMRPKTSMPVRLPGTKALKFAVEKNRLWVVDDDNIEYETKVIKLIQKDSIVNPLTRAAAR